MVEIMTRDIAGSELKEVVNKLFVATPAPVELEIIPLSLSV
jgi:hypothetical protein